MKARLIIVAPAFLAVIFPLWSSALASDHAAESAEQAIEDNHVFLFEDFPAIVNAAGSLQVKSIARFSGYAGKGLAMRSTFESVQGEAIELFATTASDNNRTSLTVSTNRSEWSLSWTEDSQPVIHGLLEPRNPAHIASMLEHGVNAELMHHYFRPAIHSADWNVFADFVHFQDELQFSHPELVSSVSGEQYAKQELQRLCQQAMEDLFAAGMIDPEITLAPTGTMNCLATLILGAGGALGMWNSTPECVMCLLVRKPIYCNPCAAALGVAVGSLMQAILTCFGDDDVPDDPPPPPPPGDGNDAPAPIPVPGGYLVPIYTLIQTTVCVDGYCWEETQLIVVGWHFVQLP